MEPVTDDLKGKVIVVSGAARALGRACAEGLLAAGAKVVATSRSWTGVEDFQAQLRSHAKALPLAVDTSDDAQVEAAYRATMERFGSVDALLNMEVMMGTELFRPLGKAPLLETRLSDWEKMYAVNVFGTVRMAQRFIQPMIEQRRGCIVTITSSGSWVNVRPDSLEQPFMSSEAAVTNLTFYLAAEVKQYNVAANVLIPAHYKMVGWEEADTARKAQGMNVGPRAENEHILPIVTFLITHDAGNGPTGKILDVAQWNLERINEVAIRRI